MSFISTDNYGYAEREIEQNWAAAYATRLVEELEEKYDADEAELEAAIDTAATAADSAQAAADTAKSMANTKAPIAHASETTTYGIGSTSAYGHLKLSDTVNWVFDDSIPSAGIAASPKAVTKAYKAAAAAQETADAAVSGAAKAQETADRAVTQIGNMQQTVQNALEMAGAAQEAVSDAKIAVYSTMPQQVGTWIDGAPIWRAAISRSLTSQEKSGGYLSISDDVPVASTGSTPGVMINSYLVATYSDGCVGEGVVLRETEPFYFTYGNSLSDYDIVRGWVEFATAADNIITEG